MFINMMKKEFVQFFRNKGSVFMMFVFPIILITTLSLGLKSMMDYGDDIFDNDGEDTIVYYTIEENSEEYSSGFLAFKDNVEEAVSLKFEEVSSLDEVKDKVDKYDAAAFFDIKDDGYSMYSSKNGEKTKTKILRSMFDTVLNQYSVYRTVAEYSPQNIRNLVNSETREYIKSDDVGDARNMSSTEFYTFAELALIILYIASTVSESIYSERTLNTMNRIKLSRSSEHMIVFAKVLMGCIICVMQTILIYFYTSICLNLDWGDHIFKFFSMFFALGLFAATLGAVVGTFSKKDTTSNALLNVFTIFTCFLGGCYVPLTQVILIPGVGKMVYLSPIYWIDTAVSSTYCNIQSNAYFMALAIPLSLSALMISLYLIFVRRKGGFANA